MVEIELSTLRTRARKKVIEENTTDCPVCGRTLANDSFRTPFRFCCETCEEYNKKLSDEFDSYEKLSMEVSELSSNGDIESYKELSKKLGVLHSRLLNVSRTKRKRW